MALLVLQLVLHRLRLKQDLRDNKHANVQMVHTLMLMGLVLLAHLLLHINVQMEHAQFQQQTVLQQHLMYVHKEKQQQQLTHVTVQAGQPLLDQVELEPANVQTIPQLILQQVVVHHQQITVLQVY